MARILQSFRSKQSKKRGKIQIDLSNRINVHKMDETSTELDLDENAPIWTKTFSKQRGSCYSLELDKNMSSIGIRTISIKLETQSEIQVYAHGHGQLKQAFPDISNEIGFFTIGAGKRRDIHLRYRQSTYFSIVGKCHDYLP